MAADERDDQASSGPGAEGGSPERARPPMPVVALGASAGGLEALQAFFAEMSTDAGIAFIVVTHVKPERTSLLPELLGRSTSLPVLAGEDGLALAPDTVVVVKDANLTIADGKLKQLQPAGSREITHHSIDAFFRQLAADQGEAAIAVVLSGSGNDGMLGIKDIKAAGGMVMVQDPDTAKYPGMPGSAVDTGLADFVLPPGRLPAALLEYCRGPYLAPDRDGMDEPLAEEVVHAILVRLRQHTGRDFTQYKRSTMSRRIRRRMAVHQVHDPQEYLGLLRDEPQELDTLFQEFLISVTSFFRDPEAFAVLAEKGVSRLLDSRRDGHTLRVWIPGCATGEEAYSIAILLDEQIRRRDRLHEVQIFATDLDARAIGTARAGVYPEGIAADISRERLQRYFAREDHSYRVNRNIRDMVVFAVQDVLGDPPFTHMDLVVCRNLLIYLDAAAQQRILPAFHYALRPDGLLFLGTSESVGEAGELFEVVDAKHKVLRRKETAQAVVPPMTGTSVADQEPGRDTPRVRRGAAPGSRTGRVLERVLRETVNPCNVVVDERDTIVFLQGPAGLYFELEQGAPRNSVLDMAREGLATALQKILNDVRRHRRVATIADVPLGDGDGRLRADLRGMLLHEPELPDGLVVISIERAEASRPAARSGSAGAPDVAEDDSAAGAADDREDLQKELRFTRENLQTTIEELRSSNEELQSTNEELQSSNEELETAKEESQSLNEELNTVNTELQGKMESLAAANDDMNNLLNSMQVATVFLDTDLRVKRFTEKARDVVRLIQSDVGRPLSDLTSTLRYDELIADCEGVLADLAPREREVQDRDGRWYLVRLLPYRTSTNVIDGLVMTVVDIDRARRAESASAAAALESRFFQSIIQTLREPLLVLDQELRVVLASEHFHRVFRSLPDEIRDQRIYELGSGQWDIPRLRELLDLVIVRDEMLKDFRIEHDFPWIGQRTFLLNARRLPQEPGEVGMILLVFEDVTGRS